MRITPAERVTMLEPVVRTARLELVPVTPVTARAALRDAAELSALLGRSVPARWPPDELRDALALHASELERDRSHRGWGVWLVLLRGGPLVGSAGFKGKPDGTGTVEIGYGIEPEHRRRGYASEAVTALLTWAWERGVRRIVAEVHPRNAASIGVLERLGMRPSAPRAGMLWWELGRP